MWILKNSKGEIFYLPHGKHTVGRRNCDLVLDNDQSISRTHAVFEISHPQSDWGNPSKIPDVKLSDAGSKYGTTLISGNNTVKMEKDVKHSLKDCDEIHFGLQWNKWSLSYEPLIVVVSALPKPERHSVRTIIGELGGHVVTDWLPQTTHLTMASVTMTIKAISALARAKPIVTPKYWVSYKTAILSRTELPKCEDYVPPIGETVLNKHEVSFLANTKRMTLFKAKTFYFFAEPQFKNHSCLVEAAGGVAKLVRDMKQKKLFLQSEAIPMQLLSMNSQTLSLSQVPDGFSEVCEFLKLHDRRLIPASEIGLAVLHCSVEKYCNPDFNFSSMLLRNSEQSQLAAPERILATETQDLTVPEQFGIKENKVIPDSGTESNAGHSMSLDVNMDANRARSTQELLLSSLQATQAATQLDAVSSQSQLTEEGPRRVNMVQSKKRLRVIGESDDELEILSPPKIPTGANGQKKKRVMMSSDGNCNTETSTSLATTVVCDMKSARKLNTSKSTPQDDSDDPDQLFADFKESHPKTNKSFALQRSTSPDMEADDLFADFQNDVNSTSVTKKPTNPAELHVMSHTPAISTLPMTHPSKRELSSDDDCGPPEKRFANLDLKQPDGELYENNQEEFMSTSQVKKEDESFNVKPSFNVTVHFKPLMISKNKISCTSSNTSLECTALVNYKKFKKVNPATKSVLPRIIGGSDLQAYNSFVGSSSVQHVIDSESDSDDDDGPDSLWAQPHKGRSQHNGIRKL